MYQPVGMLLGISIRLFLSDCIILFLSLDNAYDMRAAVSGHTAPKAKNDWLLEPRERRQHSYLQLKQKAGRGPFWN
jgi:hypothetical protein